MDHSKLNVTGIIDWGWDVMINEAMIDQAGTKALSTAIGVLGPRLVAALAKPRGQARG